MKDLMYRIGEARDIHRLEGNGRKFVLGGVVLPFEKGPVSHSDGDCLYHAVGEALLGALALGDLGKYFPDNTDEFKDCDSALIVSSIMEKVISYGYVINNLDASVILEKPKLAPYIDSMRKNIASLLKCDISQVSLKAQTNEKCGEIGEGKAIECTCIVMLRKA